MLRLGSSSMAWELNGTALDPAEIGEPAVFLLSDEARMVTGQTLCVDAGFTLLG
jgi:enoyl-[acyl-carrier-protein] reductase (NADH)